MKRLIGWLVLTAAMWFVYHHARESMTPRTDGVLIGVIAAVSFGCVAVQLIWTWKWRALSLGLLSFFLATGLLYTRASAAALGYDLWQQASVVSLIRALYLIGAVLTAAGLARWAWRYGDRAFPMWRHADGRNPFDDERTDQ